MDTHATRLRLPEQCENSRCSSCYAQPGARISDCLAVSAVTSHSAATRTLVPVGLIFLLFVRQVKFFEPWPIRFTNKNSTRLNLSQSFSFFSLRPFEAKYEQADKQTLFPGFSGFVPLDCSSNIPAITKALELEFFFYRLICSPLRFIEYLTFTSSFGSIKREKIFHTIF